MLDTIHTLRRGAQDFEAYYDHACSKQNTAPWPAIKMNLPKGRLEFNGDRLRVIDWQPIFSAIAINQHLHHIAISSSYQTGYTDGELVRGFYKSPVQNRAPAIRSKDLTLKLCRALRDCLACSPNLKSLQVRGLPLRGRDLLTLTKGLAKSNSLESLSLANCPIADEGLDAIYQSVKYSSSLKIVDFSGCNLTWRGAQQIANIIKHQASHRHSTAWAESLRYRKPEFEGMEGLRRITLNRNTLIGDRGAEALAKELSEDLWLKAVDLQKCGLSNEGAHCLLKAMKTNSTLCVLDIRSNPLVDKLLVKNVIGKVLVNAEGLGSEEYAWIKPPEHKETEKPPAVQKRRVLLSTHPHRGKVSFRIGNHRGSSLVGRQNGGPSILKPKGVPWRAAARATAPRGLPQDAVRHQSYQGAAYVKVTMETDSEEEEEHEEGNLRQPRCPLEKTTKKLTRLKVALEDCRVRLAEEYKARVQAENTAREYELENALLRRTNLSLTEALEAPASETATSSFLDDEMVLDSIEGSFSKFHAFLDLLKDAGLGQLATIAGLNQSDFEPLGRPQISPSAIGRPLARSVAGAGDREVVDKVDHMHSLSPAPPALHGYTFPSGAPTYSKKVKPDLPPQEVSPLQPRSPVMDPCLEKAQRKPSQQEEPTSCSERSFRSNRSHSNGFHGKRSHASGSRGDISNSRPHSNGSHDCSFNYSNGSRPYSSPLSNSSHGNSCRDDESLRSSVSDLIEKAGSEGKGYAGLETLEQLGSAGSVGVTSDDGF